MQCARQCANPTDGSGMCDENSKEAAKAQILALLERFRARANESCSRQEVGEHLVEVLRDCLAAYGVTLWWPHRSWLTGQRELKPDYSCGKATISRKFARSVALKPESEYSAVEDPESSVLRIGVPVMTNTNSRGVIEVLQRPGRKHITIRGYARFMKETARILSDSKAFRAN